MSEWNWFDEKYADKDIRPSLSDVLDLLKEVCSEVRLPERRADTLEDILKRAIHNLNTEYTPSNETIAYYLLFVACSLGNLGTKERRDYAEKFRMALEKHGDRRLFKPRF